MVFRHFVTQAQQCKAATSVIKHSPFSDLSLFFEQWLHTGSNTVADAKIEPCKLSSSFFKSNVNSPWHLEAGGMTQESRGGI